MRRPDPLPQRPRVEAPVEPVIDPVEVIADEPVAIEDVPSGEGDFLAPESDAFSDVASVDEIDTAVNGITKQLNSVKWVGNDANRFRNDWNGHLSSSVKKVTEALRQAGRQAKRDADEQERASS